MEISISKGEEMVPGKAELAYETSQIIEGEWLEFEVFDKVYIAIFPKGENLVNYFQMTFVEEDGPVAIQQASADE